MRMLRHTLNSPLGCAQAVTSSMALAHNRGEVERGSAVATSHPGARGTDAKCDPHGAQGLRVRSCRRTGA